MNPPSYYKCTVWLLVCILATASVLTGSIWAAYENWFNEGIEALKAQRYDQAVQAFTITVETIPNDYEAYNNRGIAWSQMGDQDRAIADYTRAIEINPDYYLAFLNRGIDWRKKGLVSNALKDYIKAIELRADYLQAYKNLAWLLATCPANRFRDGPTALRVIEKAHQITPGVILLDAEAAALAEIGQFKAAYRKQLQYLQMLEANDRRDHLAINRSRLQTYQKHQPWREEYIVTSTQDGNENARQLLARVNHLMDRDLPKPEQPLPKQDEPRPDLAEHGSTDPPESVQTQNKAIETITSETNGPWAAQVGAFAVAANATGLARKLHKADFPVFTSPIEVTEKGRLFRVLVGSFANRGDVRPTAIHLNTRFKLKSILTKLPYAIKVDTPTDTDQLQRLEQLLLTHGLLTLPSSAPGSVATASALKIGAFSTREQAGIISAALHEKGIQAEVTYR